VSDTLAVVTEVAREIGPSFLAVWEQPYHVTLLSYLGLADARRIRALEREAERIDLGYVINDAVVTHKNLQTARRVLLARLRAGGDASERPPADELMAEMMRFGDQIKPVS
jgi:hypothetical protein